MSGKRKLKDALADANRKGFAELHTTNKTQHTNARIFAGFEYPTEESVTKLIDFGVAMREQYPDHGFYIVRSPDNAEKLTVAISVLAPGNKRVDEKLYQTLCKLASAYFGS